MSRHRILLVDDSITFIKEISEYLQAEGIDIITAGNGEEGYAILADNSDISLCVTDVNMPVLDGLAMIQNIRNNNPGCTTKFIMLTTEFNHTLKKRGKELGVAAWALKPINENRALFIVPAT